MCVECVCVCEVESACVFVERPFIFSHVPFGAALRGALICVALVSRSSRRGGARECGDHGGDARIDIEYIY